MKRRASEPLPAAILHKKAAKVSASQNHKSSQQISVVTQNMKENVEPVPDVDDFSNQEILDSATDEEALSLFSNIEFDIDDISDHDTDVHNLNAKVTDSKIVASDQEDSTSSDSDSQQSNEDTMMTQAVQHQPEVEVEQVRYL